VRSPYGSWAYDHRDTPGRGHPATFAAPGAYYVPHGYDEATRHDHLIVVAKPKPGWWASDYKRPGWRRRLAHIPRALRVHNLCQQPQCLRSGDGVYYSTTWYCGAGTHHITRLTAEPSPPNGFEPCMTCVGRREQAHLRGFPCYFPCELGCFGIADPRSTERERTP